MDGKVDSDQVNGHAPPTEAGLFLPGQTESEKADQWVPYLQRIQRLQEQKQRKADEKPAALRQIEGIIEKVEAKTGLHILPAHHGQTHVTKAD